jgi:hypothetical protein
MLPVKVTFPIDRIPVSPTAYDDEFSGSALDAKWTQTNFNASPSVYTVAEGMLQVLQTNTVSGSARLSNGITQPVPTGNWEFTTCVVANNSAAVDYAIPTSLAVASGLTASDTIIQIGEIFDNGGSFGVCVNQSTWEVYGSAPGSSATPAVRQYLKVSWDGTNLTFSYSRDGFYFAQLYQGAPGFTPAYVGLLGVCQDNLFSCEGTYNWFRKTA